MRTLLSLLFVSSVAASSFAATPLPSTDFDASAMLLARADDPAGDARRGRGADDPIPQQRRGADNPAGDARRGRGADDPILQRRRGADDPVGHG
jgi:hypothetical protein